MQYEHALLRPDARRFVSYGLWPLLYACSLTGAGLAFASAAPLFWFNVVYFSLLAAIAVLERLMPYNDAWLVHDGEVLNDIGHTLLTKGIVQVAAALGTSIPMVIAFATQPTGGDFLGLWPSQWPLILQVVLALYVAEFGLYFAHRLAHEHLSLWRFHALHHSVARLWVLNTGRFHIVDSLIKAALSQGPLYLLGAPLPVFLWVGAITAVTGLLTHCNVEMRTGVLDWVFSTPNLHRWHHSKVLSEGNTNYCENVVLWDLVFGTYYNPGRGSPAELGISGRIARTFAGQIIQPFLAIGVREILGRHRRY